MRLRTVGGGLAIGVALAWGQAPALAQLPPPPPPPTTLWSFLGVPQGYRSFRDNAFNRNGNRPGLERKPPLKAIADPKNLQSPDAAIKKAAEVKSAEDLKPQKIKAIKYLAKIGCGCYNRDGSITDALIKAMDDCTEEVRYAAITAISEAAAGEHCVNCKQKSCCSEEISKKLYEIAYERDETGCYLEPSERVRLAAAEALCTCCPGGGEGMIFDVRPPTTTEGGLVPEQPSVLPPSGAEQPAPNPAPINPLQNPPSAVIPPAPGVSPFQPAPTASRPVPVEAPPATETPAPPPPRSSRRTALLQQSELSPTATALLSESPASTTVSNGLTESSAREAITQSIHILAPASNPVPLNETQVTEEAVAAEVAQPAALATTDEAGAATAALPPVVSPATLRRLPPVAGLPADQMPSPSAAEQRVPAPPLPPAGKPAIQVSTAKARLSFLKKATTPSDQVQKPSAAPAKPANSGRPGAQRSIPSAKFGAGFVSAVHLNESVALVEFGSEQAIPTGSIVRAYHEYAFAGRKPVCDLEIIRGENGLAAAVARPGSDLAALSIGDRAIVLE